MPRPAPDRGRGTPGPPPGAAPVRGVRTIESLPRDAPAVAIAYAGASSTACEIVPAGEPFEITRYVARLTPSDRADAPSSRWHAFSIGLEVSRDDRADLPAVSGHMILDYVAGHFVSVQARVRRDDLSGAGYLDPRPLAATMRFGGVRLTQPAMDAVTAAVRDFRSLGILLPSGQTPTAENLRTLVLLNRYSSAPGAGRKERSAEAEAHYEFAFLRARPPAKDDRGPLSIATFVTSADRTKLHLVDPSPSPSGPRDASVAASVRFAEYSHVGLVPKRADVRRFSFKSRRDYDVERLDDFAESRGLAGGFLGNVSAVLDAALEGEIPTEGEIPRKPVTGS